MRYGPNRISINTVAALKPIYGGKANTQKARFYSTFSYFFKVPMIVTTINKEDHAFKKHILSQALTTTAVNGMESSLLINVRKFCRHLRDKDASKDWSDAKDMSKWTAYVTSDIMGAMTFSQSWNIMESDKNKHILTIISQGVAGLNLVRTCMALKL